MELLLLGQVKYYLHVVPGWATYVVNWGSCTMTTRQAYSWMIIKIFLLDQCMQCGPDCCQVSESSFLQCTCAVGEAYFAGRNCKSIKNYWENWNDCRISSFDSKIEFITLLFEPKFKYLHISNDNTAWQGTLKMVLGFPNCQQWQHCFVSVVCQILCTGLWHRCL